MQLRSARRAIARRHCRTGNVSRRYSVRKLGRVLAQRPRAGVSRRNGAAISLVVSRGRRR
jgi:beta-lactam-binding protein with PASTA domain